MNSIRRGFALLLVLTLGACQAPAGVTEANETPRAAEWSGNPSSWKLWTTLVTLRPDDTAETLIANGGLESQENWTPRGDARLLRVLESDVAEGVRALAMTAPPRRSGITMIESEPFSLSGGQGRLRLSGQFRVEGGLASDSGQDLNRGGILVEWLNAAGAVVDDEYAIVLNGAFENWKRVACTLTRPEAAAQARLRVAVRCERDDAPPMTMAVDDLRAVWENALMSESTIVSWSEEDLASGAPEPRTSEMNAARLVARVEVASSETRIQIDLEPRGAAAAALVSVGWNAGEGEWRWSPDLIRSEAVTDHRRRSWTVSADATGNLPLSVFPLGSVSSAAETVGIAVPSVPVTMHEIFAQRVESSVQLRADFHVGLLPDHSETLEVSIHRGPGDWGARGVYAQHLARHPEQFLARGTERRVIHSGTLHPMVSVPNPEDFGFRFFQTERLNEPARAREVAARAEPLGAEPLQYLLPWADEPTVATARQSLPSLAESLQAQASGLGETGTRRALRVAGAKSRVRDTNGDVLVSEITRPSWRDNAWVLRLPMDLSLDIEGGRAEETLAQIRAARENAAEMGRVPFPLQFDNFFMNSDHVLTDEAALRACEGPLTYSPNTLEPAVPLAANHARFLRAVSDAIGSDGVMSGNVLRSGVAQFGVPHLDVIAFEGTAAADDEHGAQWSLEELAWRRALAVQRPVHAALALDRRLTGSNPSSDRVAEIAEMIWNRCLLFAITPTIKEVWGDSRRLEAVRPVYRRYLPAAERLQEAGWEPVTHVRSENPDLLLERYGDAAEVLLVAHNRGGRPMTTRVIVDWEALGMAPPAQVESLLDGEILPAEGGAIPVTLEPGASAALTLRQN
jgi:hypothetical protein